MTEEQATIARLEERLASLIDRVTKLEQSLRFGTYAVLSLVITAVLKVVFIP